jgi:hypothetical protein
LKTAKALGLTVPDRLLALAGSSIRPLPTEQRTVGVCNEAKLGGVASYDAGGMLQRPPFWPSTSHRGPFGCPPVAILSANA